MKNPLPLALLLWLVAYSAALAQTPADTYGENLGTVHFPASCNDAALQHLQRGVALLHHMTYEGAEASFAAAVEADSSCALGYWGIGMTFIHPLWSDPPDETKMKRAMELIKKAQDQERITARESAYLAALEAYYRDGKQRDERTRLARFEKGWEKVHEQFPDDLEAKSFYALAHLATAAPGDKTYANQQRAGALVEQVLTAVPDHPGAHHYIIHAYDYPPLAKRALKVSRNYGKIAPEVPHALHMPTHIFTRLGLWQESIEWNKRSAAAALKHPVGGQLSGHYLHAFDYMAYAYLQTGQEHKAREVMDAIQTLDRPASPHPGSAYALAAVPAKKKKPLPFTKSSSRSAAP